MKCAMRWAGGAAAFLCAVAAARGAEPLKSPWDLHAVTGSSVAFACGKPIVLPHDIVAYDFYSDAKHSVIDEKRKAAYDAEAEMYRVVTETTEKAADTYQKTGSAQAAACVMTWLTAEAQADAMTGTMSSNQANYVQNWTLGALAICYLKVRDAGPEALGTTPAQNAAVQAWMKKVGREVEDWFQARRDKKTNDGQNNHLYWAGFSVMAAGIAANDRGLYDWGVSTYRAGVGEIAADGTLPLEMARGQRALHYHLFALAPLVTMAELGAANGQDLYSDNHNKLHLLVSRAMAGLVNNAYFTEKAGARQDTPENGKIKAEDVIWVTPYLRRFPDADIAKLLNQAGTKGYAYLGGLPPA